MSSIFNPPNPPNPIKVANAAAAANKETAIAEAHLGNVNQVTPQGNLTYTTIGTNPDGTPRFQATQTYSPEQQAIYNRNTANQLLASQTGGAQLQAVSGKLSQPFSLSATPQQSNIDLQNDLGLGDVSLNQNLGQRTDLNYSGAPNVDDQAVSNRIQQLGQQRLDPRFAREQQTLESDLANRGVVPGTEAYTQAMESFQRSKNDAYNQLALEAQNQAFTEQMQRRGMSTQEIQDKLNAFNQANQQNQQFATANELAETQANNAAALAEGQFGNQATQNEQQFNNATLAANRDRATQDALLQRQTPLNEFSALMSGAQVSQPQFVNTPQPGVQAVDVAGIYNNNYAQQTAQYNAMLGGLAGIGGSAARAAFTPAPTSDRRAKQNIHKLGSLAKGINLYEFEYKPNVIADGGLRHIGAMAQEVEKVIPDAVIDGDNGYKAVDYNKVFEELGSVTMPYTPMYPYNEDTGIGSPSDIGKPLPTNINPLPSLSDRPKFRSRRDRERAGQLTAERGRDASSTKPLGHWTQALAQVLEGGLSGYEEGQLAKEDTARREYLAQALEGDTSPQDLMEQGAMYDVPEISDIGKFRSEQDWREKSYNTEQGWKQKGYDLEREKLDWEKRKPPEGSVPKITDVTTMRKEIQDMDSTRRYSKAIPSFNSMLKAGPGKLGDIQLVYGLAQMFDPNSVVMEGDKLNVINSQNLPDFVKGKLNALNQEGVFSDTMRAEIIREAKTRADAYKADYEANVAPYNEIAAYYKIDPKLIMPQFEPYGAVDPEDAY